MINLIYQVMKAMDYEGALDKEECKTARLLYICNIIKQFDQIKWLLPTPDQANSYDEWLLGEFVGANGAGVGSVAIEEDNFFWRKQRNCSIWLNNSPPSLNRSEIARQVKYLAAQ